MSIICAINKTKQYWPTLGDRSMKIRRKLQAFGFRNARNSANRFNNLQIDLSIMYKSDGHEELQTLGPAVLLSTN